MNVAARDKQLRTLLHYAITMRHQNLPEQAQAVMRLLLNNANPRTEGSQGRRPISIGKKRSNPIVKMLWEKGVVVEAYKIPLQDQELFEMWKKRQEEERHEEATQAKEKNEKQLAVEHTKQERDREKVRKKRIAAEHRVAIGKSREHEEMAKRRGAQKVTQNYAKEKANKLVAQKVVEESQELRKLYQKDTMLQERVGLG